MLSLNQRVAALIVSTLVGAALGAASNLLPRGIPFGIDACSGGIEGGLFGLTSAIMILSTWTVGRCLTAMVTAIGWTLAANTFDPFFTFAGHSGILTSTFVSVVFGALVGLACWIAMLWQRDKPPMGGSRLIIGCFAFFGMWLLAESANLQDGQLILGPPMLSVVWCWLFTLAFIWTALPPRALKMKCLAGTMGAVGMSFFSGLGTTILVSQGVVLANAFPWLCLGPIVVGGLVGLALLLLSAVISALFQGLGGRPRS